MINNLLSGDFLACYAYVKYHLISSFHEIRDIDLSKKK